MIYCEGEGLLIRGMIPDDARVIYETYRSYGWNPSRETYENYLREQENGERLIFIAERAGSVSGLCTLVLRPAEGPDRDCPLIEDLTVFYHVHRQGIGTHLMDAAEAEAAQWADRVFLAVGLHAGYGPAQRMYVKRATSPTAAVSGTRESPWPLTPRA